MNLLARFITRHRKGILPVFAILSLLGTILFFCTPINYNMMDYLPTEANSTKALTVMEEEFEQPMPNLNVMVENVSIPEALEIKDTLSSIEHVREVIWLDDSIDLKQPIEMEDSSTIETYYKDNNALYMVSVEDGEERAAIASIREQLGDSCKI